MDGGLRENERHLMAMAKGDLTTSPDPYGSDEAAKLMRNLRIMQDSLRGTISRVRDTSDDIVQASGEVASGAMDLSERTERAAANIEQTAASMEQIAATVRQTSDQVQQAATLARTNAAVAARGGVVMQQMAGTMDEIHTSSSKISRHQQHHRRHRLPDQHPRAECGRRGGARRRAGRGFAVVAAEVRNLAQRCAAAKDIKGLIEDSVANVDSGAQTRHRGRRDDARAWSSRCAESPRSWPTSPRRARDQSQGIEELNHAIAQMDEMTQQNASAGRGVVQRRRARCARTPASSSRRSPPSSLASTCPRNANLTPLPPSHANRRGQSPGPRRRAS